MTERRWQFYALYITRFAGGFGFITLLTLLSDYIDLFTPSGVMIGLFTAALTGAQTIAVVPMAWAGDRYDKRSILLVSLGLAALFYVGFTLVTSSMGFVLVRGAQGIAITGMGLMSLALVGELASVDERAARIGTANAWRFAAGIGGALSAGALYEALGFDAVFGVLTVLTLIAGVAVYVFVPIDETTVRGFPFTGLALNRKILTIGGFRVQYAVAVTLVRIWVPIYAGSPRRWMVWPTARSPLPSSSPPRSSPTCSPSPTRVGSRIESDALDSSSSAGDCTAWSPSPSHSRR